MGFFDGKVKEVTHDTKLKFLSRDLVCLSIPQFTSEARGEARKGVNQRTPTNIIWYLLCALTLLHQTGALSYERSFASSLDPLTFGIPPDKDNKTNSTSQINLKYLELTALSNTI